MLPGLQRGGVGKALCRAGIDACRKAGAPFVVVLGHPPYYPRFGFVPAVRFGLTFADAPPRDAFMALELEPGALANAAGRVRYAPESVSVRRIATALFSAGFATGCATIMVTSASRFDPLDGAMWEIEAPPGVELRPLAPE